MMDLRPGSRLAALTLVGDLPKPSDDATWTEVERSFFAAAPPEEPQPLETPPSFDDLSAPAPHRPRRAIIAWVRPSLAGAWRRATLVLGVAGVKVRHTARASAAGLIAAISISPVDRRRLVYASVGAIIAAGITAGGVGYRNGALTKGAATAQRKAPVSGPTVAETAPAATSAPQAPPIVTEPARVALAAPQAAPRPKVRSYADVRAPRADVSNHRQPVQRRSVPPSPSVQRSVVTAFMDRETYWAQEPRSAPDRSSRSFFSR